MDQTSDCDSTLYRIVYLWLSVEEGLNTLLIYTIISTIVYHLVRMWIINSETPENPTPTCSQGHCQYQVGVGVKQTKNAGKLCYARKNSKRQRNKWEATKERKVEMTWGRICVGIHRGVLLSVFLSIHFNSISFTNRLHGALGRYESHVWVREIKRIG